LSVQAIHHVTAIAGDPQRSVDFYAGVLGLRLVKRTVNYDDPNTYHLYYGDEVGSPGSLLAFFPWQWARRGRQGTGQVSVISLAISPAALGYWVERLIKHGVAFTGSTKRFDEQVLAFKDADGLLVEHHVAWRVADDRAQVALRDALAAEGRSVTPVIDRAYFRSVYFHEPGGVLFELAADAPGFTVDEPREHLGERLSLPPWLEPRRVEIGEVLPPIHSPDVTTPRS
jgi:catechol 2,3-dioxygenase-like lactoylglutathione lyase family enzyme